MKKLIYFPLVLAYILQWIFSVLQNICEVIANGFEEICIFLTKYLQKDASKPAGNSEPTTGTT